MGQLSCILDERLHVPDLDLSLQNQNAADHGNKHITDIADEAHDRHNYTGNKLRLPARFIQALVNLIELLERFLLAAEYFNDRVAGVHFFHMAIQKPKLFLLADELLLGAFGDRGNRHDAQRNRQYRD
ncbi:hypothetical protein D3C77_607020 [compost metagenome]